MPFTTTLRNLNASDYTGTPTAYEFPADLPTLKLRLNSAAGYQGEKDVINPSDGRTGIPVVMSEMSHQGQGDGMCFVGTIATYYDETWPGIHTSWTHGNTGAILAGQSNAQTAKANAHGYEIHMSDLGNPDVTLIGGVLSFNRTGDKTEAWSSPCIGLSLHMDTSGTRHGDSAVQMPGKWRTGIDFSRTLLNPGEQAAIALQADQRIYFDVDNVATANGEWFIGDGTTEHGDTYCHFNSLNQQFEIVIDGWPMVEAHAAHVSLGENGINSADKVRVYGKNLIDSLRLGQWDNKSYIRAGTAGTSNTSLFLQTADAGIEKDALQIDHKQVVNWVKGGTPAADPANFSADGYIEIKVGGVTKYLPYSDTPW